MKQKKSDWESVELPHIRIEVTELLEILERVSGGKYDITSETASVEFESIEEIKSQLAEFAQADTITIGPVKFDTGRKWGDSPMLTISLFESRWEDVDYTIEDARLLMNGLEKEVTSYKKMVLTPWARTLVTFAISVGAVLTGSVLHVHLSGFDWAQSILLTSTIGKFSFLIFWVLPVFFTAPVPP